VPAQPAAGEQYIVGIGDVLVVSVRGENTGGEVMVRPDGKITLPMVNEIEASGLSTEALRERLKTAYLEFFKQPTVDLQVKEINSRAVFVQGAVGKPGPYPLNQPLTVSMLLAIAGGLSEFADKSEIVIIRHGEKRPDGTPVTFRFNYRDYERRKPAGLKQDIWLKPGDVIVVPGG
jgi:polysaccharide export outer membrane protein